MKNKSLGIVQPTYLPWTNFFLRAVISDFFVLLDDVEYSKNNYFNRNSITCENKNLLLTVPVLYSVGSKQKISEIKIDNKQKWQKKHWLSIYQNYKKTKYFKLLHESLEEVYHSKYDKLVDLNIELIKIFFNYFEINKKIKLSSDFFLNSVSNNKIIEICNLLKIDNLFVKEESENYHPKAYFKENGIKLIPINYSKLYFDCIDCKNIYLNILDLACLIGPKAFKKK